MRLVFLIGRLALLPSEFFNKIDPTPDELGLNQTIRMPGYPKGSPFIGMGWWQIHLGCPGEAGDWADLRKNLALA